MNREEPQVRNTFEDILKHCDRLNYGVNMAKLREREIVSAFIPDSILNDFHLELLSAIPNKQYAEYLYKRVFKDYFLNFLVGDLKILDPKVWPQHQTVWGLALTSKHPRFKIFETPPSARTITLVIQTANRFMKYLHQQLPTLYPLIKLQPVSKAVLKLYNAEQSRGQEPIGRYITEARWNKLQEASHRRYSPVCSLDVFLWFKKVGVAGHPLNRRRP